MLQYLVVVKPFRRCQFHPELCPHSEDSQYDTNNGHKEGQLDLSRWKKLQNSTKIIYVFAILLSALLLDQKRQFGQRAVSLLNNSNSNMRFHISYFSVLSSGGALIKLVTHYTTANLPYSNASYVFKKKDFSSCHTLSYSDLQSLLILSLYNHLLHTRTLKTGQSLFWGPPSYMISHTSL